jgi:SAM-dependent methyltransferase
MVVRLPKTVGSYFEQKAVWDSCSEREENRIAATLELLPSTLESVLDVGCGDGRLLHALARRARFAVGVDLHFEPLRRLEVPGVSSSATALPFADSSFELVSATEILEHLPREERLRAIAECGRVSRRLVLASVPFRENLLEEMCQCLACGRVFHRYGHRERFEERSLRDWGGGLVLDKSCTIVPIRKTRRFPLLYWLRYRVGGAYQWDESARCPACGGRPRHDQGNLLGRAARALIWRLDRLFPVTEDGWLVALFRKAR